MGALEAMNRESLMNAGVYWTLKRQSRLLILTVTEVSTNSSILQTKKRRLYFTLDFCWPNSPTCPPLELLRTPALPHGTPQDHTGVCLESLPPTHPGHKNPQGTPFPQAARPWFWSLL